MDNLPDDWAHHWAKCSACEERYHSSGADECLCHCDGCGAWAPNGGLDGWDHCIQCAMAAVCSQCGEHKPDNQWAQDLCPACEHDSQEQPSRE